MGIGDYVEFETIGNGGVSRKVAAIESVSYHEGLGKDVFTVRTIAGNIARLTEDEILRTI